MLGSFVTGELTSRSPSAEPDREVQGPEGGLQPLLQGYQLFRGRSDQLSAPWEQRVGLPRPELTGLGPGDGDG